ncbi:hypothetical protein MJO29_003615 [Puccinia striiformis f. sp. tritici]|nr:hypothetical protein Pst134EA_006718 [Puccinia striiformis f. sp. tritici]KAH9469428.1 hypothetical protein Pst134EA_006718 [Puccinia striiformis f. sp. tritici]KAI7963188.1 hypothetical protein MJO29_003615 [Puccinia striiformis f. sp. tritici]KAI9608959.1 hypothetical protein H4Q26_005153 [Puccinia striiformis f. sp. tritici PST-130]
MGSKHPPPPQDHSPVMKRVRVNEDAHRQSSVTVVEDGSGSEYEDDPDEDAYIQRAAHEYATQAPATGSVREAGSISKVILVQFMCHRYQVVELGPQINFVIGHNGSGKSAVLTAITLVLGAKANATNRGSSLKSFIREGQNKAEVTLHLTNRGEEAFQPEIYGNEIIIERSISKDGASGFKIKSGRDQKTVSTKRDALQTILDHFMIQADNPLNVLNQDAAKKFLNASSSKQKYEFFIRGTQLQQLTDEYEDINANILMSKTLLDKKREDLPELYERAKSAQKSLKEVTEASNAKDKISLVQQELAWIYLAEAEAQRDSAAEVLLSEERILPKYEAKVQETENKLAEVEEEIKRVEAQKAARNDDQCETERLELIKRQRGLVERIRIMNAEVREAHATLEKTDKDIAEQTRLIEVENAKSLKNTDSSRQQAIERIGQLGCDITELENRHVQVEKGLLEANEMGKTANTQTSQYDNQLRAMMVSLENTQRSIQEYGSTRKNKLLLFGQSADKLKHAIETTNGWTEKPIGPLGYYIQVKDKSWQPVLETVLGGSLGSYMVVNERDEKLLRSLMSNLRCISPIIRSRRDLFDYTEGEPAPEFLTILRALNFEDELVKRALINDIRIERSILVEHRREGDPIMSNPPHLRRNIDSCFTRDGYKVGGVQGGRGVRALAMYRGPPRLSTDDGSFIVELNEKVIELESQIQETKQQLVAARGKCRQATDQIQKLKSEDRNIREKLRKTQDMKASIQDDLDQSASSNVSALEDIKRELESERAKLYDQTKELIRQKDSLHAELGPIKAQHEIYVRRRDNWQQEEEALNIELTSRITARVTTTETLKHFRDSLAKQSVKISEAKRVYEDAEARLPATIAQAKEITGCTEIVRTTRSREKVIADLETLTRIVAATEKRHGKSLEDIEAQSIEAKANYHKADTQIKEQGRSLRVLKVALSLRKERWIQFRTHIAVRAKMKFVTHLSKRGYTGKLNFNHNTQRLEIQVNTSEQEGTQGKLKDPKALSGGEKSFSTISLLLTLWDAINCPIRCLDEFDVFMDEVNRRIAIRMMIDSAKEANDVQYVFITPNGLSFIQTGDETKIIKMQDPTRNHGTLAAGQE